jgi:2-polyprenyl-3-methyl-5-hydroxy-6-metoxy-1,4-benzoquinol methylase
MHKRVFTDIYQRNLWGCAESMSGVGSSMERAAAFRDELIALLRELHVAVLLDAPCGDFNWMQSVAENVHSYIGIDIVDELIASNQKRYASNRVQFVCADLTADTLPKADLILCRDCLVHFSFDDVWRGLRNFKRTGSRYLLSTTFQNRERNFEIATGDWRPLNLQAPPFGLPPPVRAIDEKCLHTGGIYSDKRLALWELDSLK